MTKLLSIRTDDSALPAATVEIIVKYLERGRRVFGAAGASLTHDIDDFNQGDVEAGISGERSTADLVEEWMRENSLDSAVLVHSVRRPTSVGDTDHILVIGEHVVLIDSKRWKGKRKYSLTASGDVKRGTKPFPEGNINIIPALKDWRKTLGPGTKIRALVTIAQSEVFVMYDENWAKAPYKLVAHERLKEFLDKMLNKIPDHEKDHINVELVSRIISRCEKPNNKAAKVININLVQGKTS